MRSRKTVEKKKSAPTWFIALPQCSALAGADPPGSPPSCGWMGTPFCLSTSGPHTLPRVLGLQGTHQELGTCETHQTQVVHDPQSGTSEETGPAPWPKPRSHTAPKRRAVGCLGCKTTSQLAAFWLPTTPFGPAGGTQPSSSLNCLNRDSFRAPTHVPLHGIDKGLSTTPRQASPLRSTALSTGLPSRFVRPAQGPFVGFALGRLTSLLTQRRHTNFGLARNRPCAKSTRYSPHLQTIVDFLRPTKRHRDAAVEGGANLQQSRPTGPAGNEHQPMCRAWQSGMASPMAEMRRNVQGPQARKKRRLTVAGNDDGNVRLTSVSICKPASSAIASKTGISTMYWSLYPWVAS